MIEKLLAMVQDADYRVRLFLARRIGVLFQTWDGHQELFQDIWYVLFWIFWNLLNVNFPPFCQLTDYFVVLSFKLERQSLFFEPT